VQPIEAVKPLGAMAITIMWAAMAILVTKWPRQAGISISRHAAQNRKTYLMMAAVETFTLSIFFVFTVWWFVPTFLMPLGYTFCVAIASAGLILAALVPDTSKLKHKIHQIAAYTASAFFVPALVYIAVNTNVANLPRTYCVAVLVYMIGASLTLFFRPAARGYYLAYQAAYIISFHVAILLTTYIR